MTEEKSKYYFLSYELRGEKYTEYCRQVLRDIHPLEYIVKYPLSFVDSFDTHITFWAEIPEEVAVCAVGSGWVDGYD